MVDFVSEFWSWFIILLTLGGIVAMFMLVLWMAEKRKATTKSETMGHVWDEDLEELNNPLPRWWLYMFIFTLVWGVIYLIMYPGLGSMPGVLGWTQVKQYQDEITAADAEYGPLYAKYQQSDISLLATNEEAMKTAERLFINYCTVCHGSDARGSRGFPNLRDTDWLYGGDTNAIKTSIANGRTGAMPAWKDALGDDGLKEVTEYVLSLSGRRVDQELANKGKARFAMCIACHGADGKGNQALGAPNLTDNVWLHGASKKAVMDVIANGRTGNMPAHLEFLGEAKVHLLSAYIYSLSK